MSTGPSRIRRPTPADLNAVVALLNACDIAETGNPDTTPQDLENDWTLDGFDLASNTWLAVDDTDQVVGYAYTGDQLRTGELEADYWTRPQHVEVALPGRLLTLAERRAGTLARERGYDDAKLDIFCITANKAKRELLRGRGYRLVRTVYRMAADLESVPAAHPAPADITIRPFRAQEDTIIMHATMKEAFTDHSWRSNEPFEMWRERLVNHPDFDEALWLMAWEGEEAVGGVVAYDHGDLGWIKGLGVRREWRRRGIGAALLTRAFAELAGRGQRRVELGVDAESTTCALRLYEQAGMRVTYVYEAYAKDLQRPEYHPREQS